MCVRPFQERPGRDAGWAWAVGRRWRRQRSAHQPAARRWAKADCCPHSGAAGEAAVSFCKWATACAPLPVDEEQVKMPSDVGLRLTMTVRAAINHSTNVAHDCHNMPFATALRLRSGRRSGRRHQRRRPPTSRLWAASAAACRSCSSSRACSRGSAWGWAALGTLRRRRSARCNG